MTLGESRLVGRVAEIATLESFMADGGSGVLLLRGDAGIGKSMLVQALSVKAVAEGWRTLQCIGVEAESSFVLGGLSQLVYPLRDVVSRLSADDQRALQAVLGAPSEKAPSAGALTFAVLRLLNVASDAEPLLVVFDDAHCFDEVSARVITMAGRRLDVPKVRLVAVCRNEVFSPMAYAGWPQMLLGALDADQSASFLDELGVDLPPTARSAVLEQADGNPLALAELSRSAAESGWSRHTPLPLTQRLIALFGDRLQHLDERVRAELLCGALDGVATHGAESALERTRYVMRGAEAALRCGLVVTDGRGETVFRHPLVSSAVIQASTANQRRSAHAFLAGLYPDDVMRRAAHLANATVHPDDSVADTLAEAADLTVRRGGAWEAVELLRRAAELSSRPLRREELLADAAFVASQAARLDEAERLCDDIRLAGRASDVMLLTSSYVALYRDGDVIGTQQRLVERLQSPDSLDSETLTRMVNLLLTVGLHAGDPGNGRIIDDLVDVVAGRLSEVTLIYRDALADAARRGHSVRQRLTAYLNRLPDLAPWDVMRLALAGHFVDMVDEFRPALPRTLDRELDSGAATNAMVMLGVIMFDQLGRGQWAAASDTAQRGLALSTEHHYHLFGYEFKIGLGLLAANRGDVVAARDFAAQLQTWAHPRQLGHQLGFAQQIAVLCGLAEADYESAYQQAAAITRAGEFPLYSHQATRTMLDFVEAAVYSGHLDDARKHVRAAEHLGLAGVSPRLAIVTGGAAAICAPDELALALFDKVLDHAAVESFPFEQARIRLSYGMHLRRMRRYATARVVLSAAAELFTRLGAEVWAQRARNEFRLASPRQRRSTTAGPARLSAQERRIAELAAKGLTNKHIAAQLFLSPRTVGVHLYRLFPKLGVTARAGLRDALDAFDAGQRSTESSD